MSIVIFGVNFLGYILALVKIWLRAAPSLSCFLLLLPKPSGAVVTSVFGGIPYTFPPEEFQALCFFRLLSLPELAEGAESLAVSPCVFKAGENLPCLQFLQKKLQKKLPAPSPY